MACHRCSSTSGLATPSLAVTAWGGQMIDAAFGDTFMFDGRMRPETVLGMSLQKRIFRAGPLAIEMEADLFSTSPNSSEAVNSTNPSPTRNSRPRASGGDLASGHGSGFNPG